MQVENYLTFKHFQIRTLLLQQRRSSYSKNRYIKHFHYLTWPAYPQRNCTTTFLQFLNRLHEKLEMPEEDDNDVVKFYLDNKSLTKTN